MSTINSLGSVTLRPAQCRPEHAQGINTISTDPYHRIEFKHPSYPSEYNTFLVYPALDHPSGGLHYNTAKIACGIIAGNRWDGYFTTTRDGEALDLSVDDILPHGEYYFFLPGYRYGEAWLPKNWRKDSFGLSRSNRCLIPYHSQLHRVAISSWLSSTKLAASIRSAPSSPLQDSQ